MEEAAIRERLAEIESTGDAEVRVTRRMEIGRVLQQGDLYVHRVADDHMRGNPIGRGSVQVALGTGNGARHVAEGAVEVFGGARLPSGVRAPMDVDPMELCGPVVVAAKPWMLTHPEHPHHKIPSGTYQVTYQFDARTMRRVVD